MFHCSQGIYIDSSTWIFGSIYYEVHLSRGSIYNLTQAIARCGLIDNQEVIVVMCSRMFMCLSTSFVKSVMGRRRHWACILLGTSSSRLPYTLFHLDTNGSYKSMVVQCLCVKHKLFQNFSILPGPQKETISMTIFGLVIL